MAIPEIHRRGAAVLLVAFTLLGAGAGVLVGVAKGPQWKATSTVLVQWTPSDVLSLLLNGSATQVGPDDLTDVAGSIDNPAVLSAVATRLGDGSTSDEISRSLSADPVAASHLITITATATTGERAESIAGAAANTLAAVEKAAVTAATGNLPAAGTSPDAAQLQLRAQLVGSRVDPVRLMGRTSAVRTSPSSTTPVALAVVGLAAAGLIVIGLSLRGTRRQQAVGIRLVPLVRLPRGASTADTVAAATGALPGWPHAAITIEPVGDDARPAAERLALRLRSERATLSRGVGVGEPEDGSIVVTTASIGAGAGHEAVEAVEAVADADAAADGATHVLVVTSVNGVLPDGVVALAERRRADLVVLAS